ncbi:MAG: glycosyltransferase family 39 protein, partial [Gaiellaceae bacterium]
VCYLVGLASFGMVAQLLYVLGASLSRPQVIAVCAVLAAAGLGALRHGPGATSQRRPPAWVVAVVVAMLVFLAVDLWYQPLWAYDSWTFWTPKAHALYALNGLEPAWFGAHDLLNRDYPLLLPAVESATFRFTGFETRLLDIQSLLVLAAFLAAAAEVAVRLNARMLVLAAALLSIVFAPSVADQLAAAEADIPVAAFFAGAGLCAVVWLEQRRRGALILAGILAGGAAATKIEGTVFVIALFLALALVERRAALRPALVGVGALLAGIVPWKIWLSIHHVPQQVTVHRLVSPSLLAGHVDRLPRAAAYMAWKIFDPRAWIVLVPLCLAIAFVGRRRAGRTVQLALLGSALALLGLLIAYWTTPLPFHYHLATSARRIVTGPIFFLAALTPIVARGGPSAPPSDPAGDVARGPATVAGRLTRYPPES